jgi:hypothetical protein
MTTADKRDPRRDPKPGDQLSLGKVLVRILPCEVSGQVFYALKSKRCQIDKLGWIDWCAAMDAEVLHAAD